MPSKIKNYASPMGEILLAGMGDALTGLWFAEQRFYADSLPPDSVPGELPVFDRTRQWLDLYFAGIRPDFTPLLAPIGTPFRLAVWELLREIPWGAVVSYGTLAARVAERTGKAASPRAVGGAVAHNPISLIIPCHRVIGADGRLPGYAGGLSRKRRLLELERGAL